MGFLHTLAVPSPLTELNLTGCTGLTSLKGIEDLPLKYLNISGCTGLGSEEQGRAKAIKTLEKLVTGPAPPRPRPGVIRRRVRPARPGG